MAAADKDLSATELWEVAISSKKAKILVKLSQSENQTLLTSPAS
jgi:hypothetical protein